MRRLSRSFLAFLLPLGVVLAVSTGPVTAQDQTGIGTEIPFVDDAGVTRGTIEISEYNDPFTGNDPDYSPEEGKRYVGLIAAFTAADDQTFDAAPYAVQLHDTDGYLHTSSYIPRPATDIVPDLQGQTMAPSNKVSGFIGYSVPESAVIAEIIYNVNTYRQMTLVDLDTSAGPAISETVPFVATDGSQASMTLSFTDPFQDFLPSAPADPEMRFVGVTAVIENTGTVPFAADPTDLYLRGADGTLYYTAFINRPPDVTLPNLEAQTMAPGDKISGFIGYEVPADAVIVGIDLWSESARRVEVADLVGGGPAPSAPPAPSVAPASAAPATAVPSQVVGTDPPAPSATPQPSAGVSQ